MTAKGCFVFWFVLFCVTRNVLVTEIDGCAEGDLGCRQLEQDDLQLASKLLNDQKVKKNFVAAFEIMKQASNVITEQQHSLSAPSTSGLGLENENSEIEEAAEEPTESMGENDNEGYEDLHVVALHTSEPAPKPEVLNMMAEDLDDSSFRPTPLPLTNGSTIISLTNSSSPKNESTKSNATTPSEEPRGRALNFTLHESHDTNNLSNSTHHDEFDLSDVTIGDDDGEENMDEMIHPRILVPTKIEGNTTSHNVSSGVCEKGGLTYENGEKLENGCDSICTCKNGKMECEDRCRTPFIRKGNWLNDPLCSAKDTDDPCCSVMVCAGDTETEPLEMCSYNNKTYNRGDSFNKDCSEVCTCDIAGEISCKARCPQVKKTSESCVEISDPNDACCKKVLCDVSLDDHQDKEKEEMMSEEKHEIISATQANSSVILMDIKPEYEDENLPVIEVSNDKKDWDFYQLFPKGQLFVKGYFKYVRIENTEEIFEVEQEGIDKANIEGESYRSSKDVMKEKSKEENNKLEVGAAKECEYKGKKFKSGEEYNDNCEFLCLCREGEMKCLKLECPTYFGVDVLNPSCVDWETIPPDFKPSAPNCCPEQVRCKNNGSCLYEGVLYKNWDQLPINVTGCEKRCYCEMGNVECQVTCPPVPALPPANLPCSPSEATLQHGLDDDCCMYWVCSDHKTQATFGPPKNKTKTDKKEQTRNQTHFHSGPFVEEKPPSKILGPLTVYTNEDPSDSNTVDPLGRPHLPHLSPAENPFFRIPTKEISSKAKKKPHPEPPISYNNEVSNFVGELIPNNLPIPKKPNKFNTTTHALYPPHNVPNIQHHPVVPINPSENQISIHGQGHPEDLLQFLQQLPEITNLPSGSVVEIQSLPTNKQPVNKPINTHPSFLNMNDINLAIPNVHPHQSHPLVPAILHPEQPHFPPDVSLQQIIEELHKNMNSQEPSPLVPFPHTPPYYGHDLEVSGTKRSNITAGARPQDAFNNHYPDDFGYNEPRDDITVHALEALDPHTIRLAFMVPPVIVGLHGRVEVRYTYKDTDDMNSWDLQVFAPPNDLIATPSLEFDLLDLVPDKEYKIKITITLRDLHNTPSSKIYKIKTPKDVQTTTLPPQIPIEPDLEISDINATWVTIIWRKFTDYELQFIDGVQLRFRESDTKIYTATPLIHRAVTTYTIEKLKPNTKYEIGIFFIPFPGQHTELNAEHMLQFTTANEVDTYGFSVTLDVSVIKSTTVEISWSGVPYPEDKYVNIYRAIYQSDSGKEDQSTFKIAKRDSPTKTIITDLKPGTRYRLWLEVYLTNGKIKTSNVQDFITKPRAAPALGSSSQNKVSRAELLENTRGDYYGPLVIVAILAAIAILSTLILLLILVRRHNQNKAAITPPSARISQSAYDNPTYKVEIQQETMGL